MRRLWLVLALGLGLGLPAQRAAAEVCAPDRLDIRGPWGAARFSVEIADDEAERNQGLMFRESLAASQGMLFVYQEVGAPSFWMRNTLIPLDMVFVTPEGRVQHIHEMARPGDLTPISGGPGVIAVLEIRGGLARAIGITPGSEIRHPAFAAATAGWPCDGGDDAGGTGTGADGDDTGAGGDDGGTDDTDTDTGTGGDDGGDTASPE